MKYFVSLKTACSQFYSTIFKSLGKVYFALMKRSLLYIAYTFVYGIYLNLTHVLSLTYYGCPSRLIKTLAL